MTQTEMILRYLEDNNTISAYEAVIELGILQLAARICDLEKLGYKFTKTPVKSKNRYGESVRFIRYGRAS